MRRKTKLLSVLLTLTMAILTMGAIAGCDNDDTVQSSSSSSSSVNSSPDENEHETPSPTEGLVYTLSADETYYIVTDYTGTATSVYIPNTYKNLPVKEIDGWAFRKCRRLTSITISNGVTSIGKYAFSGCDNLTEIIIPNSVTSISDGAFFNCDSLTKIVIPNSVTSIGHGAFYDCNSLQYNIKNNLKYLGNENNPYLYLAETTTTDITTVVIGNDCKFIDLSAFYDCNSLTEITVDKNNTAYKSIDGNLYSKDEATLIQYAIGKKATSFTIPDSVTYIGDTAFYGCSNLTEIVIPDAVTYIGDYAFYGCSNLTEIVIPDAVTYIGDYAFRDCDNLTSATCPTLAISSLTKSSLKTVVITSGDSIGSEAFEYCSSLTSVTIGNGVTSIGSEAFFFCDSLAEIIIPDSVTEIGSEAFYGCDSLTEITIPNGVTSIGWYAFADCDSLTSVTIGNSVTSIGDKAFYNCDSLTEIVIPNGVTSIAEDAFAYCESLTLYCEVESKPDGWNSSWNASYCPVVWDCNNNDIASDGYIYTVIDGVRYGIKDGVATVVIQPENIISANIPASITYKGTQYKVTSIGDKAFYNCDSLTEIVIPDSVTSIGDYAFSGCSSLTEIVIPDSVISIGDSAFSGCSSLTEIEIPDSVTSIGNYAFSACRSLTEIVIPDSVTSIGYEAFSACRSLTIYCEAKWMPSGWAYNWNYSNRPVVWGYTEE